METCEVYVNGFYITSCRHSFNMMNSVLVLGVLVGYVEYDYFHANAVETYLETEGRRLYFCRQINGTTALKQLPRLMAGINAQCEKRAFDLKRDEAALEF
jgi:tRNA U34 5-carboxymethylaminomethyl modifying enzyme MnmG/GidA